MRRMLAAALALLIALPGPVSAAAAERYAAQDVDLLRQYASKLPVGGLVKVRLRSGGSVKGILMLADDEGIVVKPKTRLPEPERRLPFSTIDMIELEQRGGMSTAKAVGIGVASGVATFFGIMLIIIAAFND
jgi:hypothetical protein